MQQLLAQVNIAKDLPLGTGDNILSKYPDAASLVNVILRNSIVFAGILATCFLIYGGVTYIMGAGTEDPKELQKAKTTITEAVIGLLIVISVYFILQIIQVLTGAKIL